MQCRLCGLRQLGAVHKLRIVSLNNVCFNEDLELDHFYSVMPLA